MYRGGGQGPFSPEREIKLVRGVLMDGKKGMWEFKEHGPLSRLTWVEEPLLVAGLS